MLSKLCGTISRANYYRTVSAGKWHFTSMQVSGGHIWW